MREADIEDYLVCRVMAMGGEVRKVQWVGRRGAPDRLVMLPQWRPCGTNAVANWGKTVSVWVELKAPGKAATFPANAHERQQAREHERMREMGQRVEVIDSLAGVEALLS
jgi:hypothetical protein